jgi:hypothetical protein
MFFPSCYAVESPLSRLYQIVYMHISMEVKLTTCRPSLVTSYIPYPDINGRRHLHRYIVASPTERDTYRTTHHAVARLPITSCCVAHRMPRYQRSSAVPITIHHVACLQTQQHGTSSLTCATIQSTMMWWSERVDVSLVLPARGCLRVGGCRCTPLAPVVVIVGFTWTGRPMMRGGTR